MLADRLKGRYPIHKSWWTCTEQEYRNPKPNEPVRVTDHETECYDWYSPDMDIQTYFCYTNTNRKPYHKGE